MKAQLPARLREHVTQGRYPSFKVSTIIADKQVVSITIF